MIPASEDAGSIDRSAADASVPDDGEDAGPSPEDAAVDAPPPPDCGGTGATYYYVINMLALGLDGLPAGVRPGVDLDHRTSDEFDPEGCYHEDSTSPAPESEPGVDNEGGPLLRGFSAFVDVEAAIAETLAAGEALIVIELSGVDDFVDDSCVVATVWNAAVPLGGTLELIGDVIAPGQAFDLVSPLGSDESASIVGGRLHVGPVFLRLTFSVGGFPISFDLNDAELRFPVDGTSGEPELGIGIVAGALSVAQLNSILSLAASLYGLPAETFTSQIESAADLQPDAEGACQGLSTGLVTRAVPAERNEF